MNKQQLDILGIEIVDKANSILALQRLPLPPQDIIRAFAIALKEIRDTGRNLHIDISGEDPWDWTGWAE